jgi:hypothetical protein
MTPPNPNPPKKSRKYLGYSLLILAVLLGIIFLLTGETETPDRKLQAYETVSPLVEESRAVIETEKARKAEAEEIIDQTDSLLICSTSYSQEIESCRK